MKKVIIASGNPVKINTAKLAFEKFFPEEQFEFIGIPAESGVSDQPMSNAETMLGAKNRVINAILKDGSADFYVGMEGGVEDIDNQLFSYSWIIVSDKSKQGIGKSASFKLPPKITELIKGGMELGDADQVVFGVENSKQKMGAIGLLSKGVVNRTDLYVTPTMFALLPFINKQLY
jgi:inosine/xanthosine triphosphatase